MIVCIRFGDKTPGVSNDPWIWQRRPDAAGAADSKAANMPPFQAVNGGRRKWGVDLFPQEKNTREQKENGRRSTVAKFEGEKSEGICLGHCLFSNHRKFCWEVAWKCKVPWPFTNKFPPPQ